MVRGGYQSHATRVFQPVSKVKQMYKQQRKSSGTRSATRVGGQFGTKKIFDPTNLCNKLLGQDNNQMVKCKTPPRQDFF